MATVVRRDFLAAPARDANSTWRAIVHLLTGSGNPIARGQLDAVTGVASSIIADRVPAYAPILVTCDGPRTRIYCVYDDDALDDSNANEAQLGFNALQGDWKVSLPCMEDDLDWIQVALKSYGTQITARGGDSDEPYSKAQVAETLVLDPEGFLRR